MNYILMRKNEPITMVQFSEDGTMTYYSKNILNEDIAPLQHRNDSHWLQKWWNDRSVPISQGRIAEMLERKHLLGPRDYLVKNLGLSLTDYYWVKPEDLSLTWEDVNLFDNEFKENLFIEDANVQDGIPAYTPNSSLQGQLEKTWSINENGERILIKGNRDNLSAESLNEVIASEIHREQGYDNYTPYYLMRIKDMDYDYGCYSKLFTTQETELVSAYAILTSESQPSNRNSYEQFIYICGKHGMDKDLLRCDLEYQIMVDFVLSNTDRHMNNISVVRDADTLQFLRMAPIYDSGKSFFVGKKIPSEDRELFRVRISSFSTRELKLLEYVQDRSLVDISKFPSSDYIREMYYKDSQADENRIESIVGIYEHKLNLLDQFQHGKSIDPRHVDKKDTVDFLIEEKRIKAEENLTSDINDNDESSDDDNEIISDKSTDDIGE